MIKIIEKSKCCGCESCVQACPKQCISFSQDSEGFFYPEVDSASCVNCGLCEKVCPILNKGDIREPIITYAVKNPVEIERLSSSSGGVFVSLAKFILSKGGVVFGAVLNDDLEVVHTYAENIEELKPILRSKYVQSKIGNTYSRVENFLKGGRKVLFSGTPCQIRGLKLFLHRDYSDLLLTVDVVCHGVPSPGIWKRFILEENAAIKAAAGKNMVFSSLKYSPVVTGVNFRDKRLGWKKYGFSLQFAKAKADGEDNLVFPSIEFNKSPWGKAFVQNLFLRPSCHSCMSKCLSSNSDITLGDFWGVEKKLPLFDDDKGVSAVLLNTEKGQKIFESLSLVRIPLPFQDVLDGNKAIEKSWPASCNRNAFFKRYRKGQNVHRLIKKYCAPPFKHRIKSYLKSLNPIIQSLKVLKSIYNNIVVSIDYKISLLLSFFIKSKVEDARYMLIPAAGINGGFGEDIMVAGFINSASAPVTIFANQILNRSYLDNNNVSCITGYSKNHFYTQAIEILRRHSDLYIIGADILDGVYGDNTFRFNMLKLAHAMGLRTHITGFSVREYSSEYFKKKIKEVSIYTKILARDVSSYSRLKKLCDNVILTSDIAFLCPSPNIYECDNEIVEWVETRRNNGNKIIAYCPNTIQADKIGLKTYLNNQKILLESFAKMDCSILFLYHDLRKYVLNMSDKELSKMLSCYFPDKGVFVDDITDGLQLKAYLRLADFTVTGRMHFGISGYTIGLPMFGLSYYGKFEGLQALFGIEANSSLVDYDKVIDNLDVINRFLQNIDDFSNNTKENLFEIIKKAELNII